MNDSVIAGADGALENNIKKNSKDPATLKAKREANVTAGLGYGLKKKRLLDAFWNIIWPGLENIGWRRVQGEGINDGTEFFFPPDTEIKPGNKRVGDCYDKIKSIIERVEERRNKDEAKLADLFREETRDDESIALLANPRRNRGRPSLGASRPSQKIVDISWKDGGSLYPKRSSQVGEDYQVSFIPPAGTYQDEKNTQEQAYELIWDNEKAAKSGAIDFVRDKVPYNKKEKALEAIHRNDYDLSTIDEIIRQIRPSDGSDWTPEEKDKFHTEIFRCRKNIRALCKSSGKRMDNILGYYLGKYKTSDDYRLLKTLCAEERIEKAESSAHVVDECAACGDGGNLLICDGCESEWHTGCTKPALKTVPEGYWLCDRCVDRAFLDARRQIMQGTRLFSFTQQDDGKRRKINATDKNVDESNRSPSLVVNAVKAFSTNITNILSSQDSQPRPVDVTSEAISGSCALPVPHQLIVDS